MNPVTTDFGLVYPYRYLPVMLNGILLGYLDPKLADIFVKNLRALKVAQNDNHELYGLVPKSLEVAYLPQNHSIDEEEED